MLAPVQELADVAAPAHLAPPAPPPAPTAVLPDLVGKDKLRRAHQDLREVQEVLEALVLVALPCDAAHHLERVAAPLEHGLAVPWKVLNVARAFQLCRDLVQVEPRRALHDLDEHNDVGLRHL